MMSSKALIAFGLVCLVVAASAQTDLSDITDPSTDAGTYVVDGTGVEYDDTSINLLVNGTVVQTLPRNAAAPGPAKPPKSHDHDLGFGKKTPFPMPPSPSGSPSDIKGSLDKPDPLDKIVIGRKMRL